MHHCRKLTLHDCFAEFMKQLLLLFEVPFGRILLSHNCLSIQFTRSIAEGQPLFGCADIFTTSNPPFMISLCFNQKRFKGFPLSIADWMYGELAESRWTTI